MNTIDTHSCDELVSRATIFVPPRSVIDSQLKSNWKMKKHSHYFSERLHNYYSTFFCTARTEPLHHSAISNISIIELYLPAASASWEESSKVLWCISLIFPAFHHRQFLKGLLAIFLRSQSYFYITTDKSFKFNETTFSHVQSHLIAAQNKLPKIVGQYSAVLQPLSKLKRNQKSMTSWWKGPNFNDLKPIDLDK